MLDLGNGQCAHIVSAVKFYTYVQAAGKWTAAPPTLCSCEAAVGDHGRRVQHASGAWQSVARASIIPGESRSMTPALYSI